MKALIFRETGEPKSVLKLAEIATPPVAAGEALVRVLLSPINPSDLHMVRGRYGYQPELPASPGAEGVGIVEAVGPGVQGPIVGTRVVFVQTWIHHAALRSAFDLFDRDSSRMVASALGEFPATRRSAGSDERSPHHVVERRTYAASDCAVFI